MLAAAGADTVRFTVDWTWVERTKGRLGLGLYDATYQQQLARGIRPVVIVMGAPGWAWPRWVMCPAGRTCHFPPDRVHDQRWKAFVKAVALRFRRAAAIEVWNEPNLSLFWGGAPDPARYTDLLRLAREAVDEVAPGTPVLGGSLAAVLTDVATPHHMGVRPFLRGMYAEGARGQMDGISLHPYPVDRVAGRTYQALDYTVEARDDAGDDVPIWITELGHTLVGERRQAVVLGDLLPRLMRRPGVRSVLVHTLVDSERHPIGHAERHYGVFTPDRRPKQSLCAVARAFGGARCEVPEPTPEQLADWDAQERVQEKVEALQARWRRTGPDAAPVELCEGDLCVTVVHGGEWRFTRRGTPLSW